MNKAILKLLLIPVLVLCVGGCASTNGNVSSDTDDLLLEEDSFSRSAMPTIAAKLRFEDLPVPTGFKLIQEKSFVFQSEGTRVALLKYAGRGKTQELVKFYKDQMLLYNWELLNIVEYDKSVLNFNRGNQSCIVTIEALRGSKNLITLSVAPKRTNDLDGEDE